METSKILNADFLDILFDGKNKDYGAYDLRKTYNKRIATALVSVGSMMLLFLLGTVLANVLSNKKVATVEVAQEVILEEVKQPEKKIEVPPLPAPKLDPPPKVQMTQFNPPQIVPDNEVKDEEKAPEMSELEDSKIGAVTQDGAKDDGFSAPPTEMGVSGGEGAPTIKEEDYEKTFIHVETPAQFEGGPAGWKRYLERNFQYPEAAIDGDIQGVINVQLVVDKEGNISEVKALNDLGGGTAAEAERVIRKGPKWKPAEQNGHKVSYRFTQKVIFQTGN